MALEIKEGMVVEASFWPEPVEIKKIEDLDDYVRIVGATKFSDKHVDQLIPKEDIGKLRVKEFVLDFSAAGEDLFLAAEAERFRLASLFDPLLAMQVSKIDPLPFQIEAVYGRILKLPHIRFLIADDPGAGKTVMAGLLRKYYRTARAGRWYGGIATADCCGCCLKCVFCWSGAPRDHPETIGKFYSPEHVFNKLTACAEKFGYQQLRVSGNEPTIGRDHLFKLLELVDGTHYKFILESNGILIDSEYAKRLSEFKRVHVRISLKGTNREEFSLLTGAVPEAFDLQLESLRNLLDAGVSCHPAVMLSFSPKKNLEGLKHRLRQISPFLADEVEEEYIFLYPRVVERLSKAGIRPRIAYRPNKIPNELI